MSYIVNIKDFLFYLIKIICKYILLLTITLLICRLVDNFLYLDLLILKQIINFCPWFGYKYINIEMTMWLILFMTAQIISDIILYYSHVYINPKIFYPLIGFLFFVFLILSFVFLFMYKIKKYKA